MHKLKVIASTARPGNKGTLIANWIMGVVRQDRGIHAEFLDLAEMNLPVSEERSYTQSMQYEHEHTKQWSATITESDAFIIVLEEHDPGFPLPIRNALDCLYKEWKYKPVAFVSYGEICTGWRSTQTLKQIVKTLGMMPISQAVSIPSFSEYIDDEDKFLPKETITRSAYVMLSELKRWSNTLKNIRSQIFI
jgi:NAD(P)H-dependent FMN reductase